MPDPKLSTAENRYRRDDQVGLPPAERALRHTGLVPMTMAMAPASDAIAVQVNQGRWIVECPDCHGAQFASFSDRRFLCCDCGNVAIDGKWRPVEWPANPEAIEVPLLVREPTNRNWFPGETVADLQAENAVHGLGEG